MLQNLVVNFSVFATLHKRAKKLCYYKLIVLLLHNNIVTSIVRANVKMKSRIIILLTLTYVLSLSIPSFVGNENRLLATNCSVVMVLDKDSNGLLFSMSLSTEQEQSNSETDSSVDDDEIIGQFAFDLFIPPGCLSQDRSKNNLATISLATPLLPPENHS